MLLFCGICGPSSYSLSCSLLFVDANVTSFWDSMGHARFNEEFGVLLEQLVWEIFFGYLEFDSWLLDVGYLDGKK